MSRWWLRTSLHLLTPWAAFSVLGSVSRQDEEERFK